MAIRADWMQDNDPDVSTCNVDGHWVQLRQQCPGAWFARIELNADGLIAKSFFVLAGNEEEARSAAVRRAAEEVARYDNH